MTFPKTVTLVWTDPNPAGSVVDYLVTRNGVAAGTVNQPKFVDSVMAPGTYVYGVSAHNASESTPAVTAQVALISLVPVTNLTISVS